MEGLKPKQPAQFQASAKANYMEALAFLILSGHYIAYLPTHYAAPWIAAGQMRSLLPEKLAYQSLFELITRKGVQPTPAHHAFLADLWEAHRPESTAPLPTPRQDPKPPARDRRRTVSQASAAS